jgi:hypothetical protein
VQDVVAGDIKLVNIMFNKATRGVYIIDVATFIDHKGAPLGWFDKGGNQAFLPPEFLMAKCSGASPANISARKTHKVCLSCQPYAVDIPNFNFIPRTTPSTTPMRVHTTHLH